MSKRNLFYAQEVTLRCRIQGLNYLFRNTLSANCSGKNAYNRPPIKLRTPAEPSAKRTSWSMCPVKMASNNAFKSLIPSRRKIDAKALQKVIKKE